MSPFSRSFLYLLAPALLTGAEIAPAPAAPSVPARASLSVVQADIPVTVSAADTPVAEQTAAEVAPHSAGYCPEGMVEVAGEYCESVAQYCVKYDGDPGRDRCIEFRTSAKCLGAKKPIHVCVDRFEYPNKAGEKPVIAVDFDQASQLCAAEGKRLCTANEWTMACEGPERLPYPYGNARDSQACNIDKPYIMPNDSAFVNPATRDAELARVDQREPAGARAGCVSAYGVQDMTGNVDEWVLNEGGSENSRPYNSGLKGGWWGPVRNRCRPMTLDHNKWHKGYQIGFRCCSDVRERTPSAAPEAAAGVALRGS